jgi:hypothetical protein
MTKAEKVGPIDAHGGVRHKKGMNQARSESKSPVCRLYAHGVRRVGPTSLCSVAIARFLASTVISWGETVGLVSVFKLCVYFSPFYILL